MDFAFFFDIIVISQILWRWMLYWFMNEEIKKRFPFYFSYNPGFVLEELINPYSDY